MRRLRAVRVLLAFVAAGALAQSFQERVHVELVRVELLATDRQGRPLIGLSPAEIQVKVDGKPVPIESFEAPTPSLPEIPAAAAPPAPLPSASRLGVSPTPPPIPPARHPYYMAFLVDETSSEQSNRQTVYKQLFEFFQKTVPSDVEVLLMRFNGALHVETSWTSDAARLRGGVAAMSQRKAAPLLGGPGQLSDSPEQGAFNLQLEATDTVIHVRTSLAGLFDALRVFPESPGRKALFVVKDGAPFLAPSEIAKDLIATSPTNNVPGAVPRGLEEPNYDRDLLFDSLAWSRSRSASMLTEVTRLAVLRNIEVHPVRSAAHDFDGRVRADRGFHDRARAPSRKPLETPRDAAAPPTTDIAAGQGMEATAEATGGDAILSRRFIQDGVRREVSLRDAACALSFRDPFAGDHRFHKIEVTSQKQGVQLRYRRGYRVLDTQEGLIQGITNRLQLSGRRESARRPAAARQSRERERERGSRDHRRVSGAAGGRRPGQRRRHGPHRRRLRGSKWPAFRLDRLERKTRANSDRRNGLARSIRPREREAWLLSLELRGARRPDGHHVVSDLRSRPAVNDEAIAAPRRGSPG